MWQRIDGLRCERGVIDHDWWFFGLRLHLMVEEGLLEVRPFGSILASCNGMPGYRITDEGRNALTIDTDLIS
jgi:hypothetical protein